MHFIEATSRGVETNLPQAAWIWVSQAKGSRILRSQDTKGV